ncbi:MAG: MFS transporter [Candidatus Parvarchaeota archaeon]|nr:MFS transporter [Candidatus Jingweiarchaeum tengchongense]MCW1306199.1 MFS transporter [Candidatus Jingweiarchaeum tengchongense]MCW1309699.1 MFS transporter [Candidatus Jingweiarchaeum tengchongense]
MLNELQKSHARKISIIEGSVSAVWGSFTGGNYLTGLFIWLGAGPISISLYGASGPLANVIQPFFLALLGRSVTNKKKFIIISVALFKPLFFILVLTSLINSGLKVWIALAVLFFFQIVSSMAGPVWTRWMTDIVGREIYGKYFGLRNLITQIVAAASTLLAGYLLDIWGKGFWAFLFVFVIGSVFGLLDILAFMHQDDESLPNIKLINYHVFPDLLKIPTNYRKYMISIMVWIFTMNIFGPYATVMMISEFKYNYAILGLLSVVSSLAVAVFQPIFGKLGDKFGNFKVLRYTLTIQTMLNVGWILAVPSMYYMIPFQLILGIIGTAGTGLISSNFLMEIVPSFGKTEAFAIYASITNLAAFGGNMISGFLFLLFSRIHFKFIIWNFDAYRFVFMISVLASVITLYNFLRLKMASY